MTKALKNIRDKSTDGRIIAHYQRVAAEAEKRAETAEACVVELEGEFSPRDGLPGASCSLPIAVAQIRVMVESQNARLDALESTVTDYIFERGEKREAALDARLGKLEKGQRLLWKEAADVRDTMGPSVRPDLERRMEEAEKRISQLLLHTHLGINTMHRGVVLPIDDKPDREQK